MLLVVGGLATVKITAQAEEPSAPPAGSAAVRGSQDQAPPPAAVTLPTGERVRLTSVGEGRSIRLVEPAVRRGVKSTAGSHAPSRLRTMDVGDHYYVVPDSALPYLGRQLDLALFDVLAPPAELTVEWAAGATPRAVPGLALRRTADGRSIGRITKPAA
ncbi:MAG TPA: hypothetical protein VFO77_15165, partial [Actinoplanes sp.]|nr:hypothetical protein [Actinoplanes sp.]